MDATLVCRSHDGGSGETLPSSSHDLSSNTVSPPGLEMAGNVQTTAAVVGDGPGSDPLERLRHQASAASLLPALDHDMRNAINVIKTAAFYLRTKVADLDPRLARHLELINGACGGAVQLLEDVHAYAGQRPPHLEPQDPALAVKDALDRCGTARSRVQFSAEDGLPLVPLDRDYLGLGIARLIQRAVDVTPGDEPVRLTVSRAPGGIEIAVEDGGPAMAEKHRESLFAAVSGEPGARATTMTIALLSEIIKAHHGQARCDAVGECGSRISITLLQQS